MLIQASEMKGLEMENEVDKEISEAEKRGRRAAMDFACGSVYLEGFVLTPEAEAENERFVNGEITIQDMIDAANKRYKKI